MNKLKICLLASALMLGTTALAAETTTVDKDVYVGLDNKVVAGDIGGLETYQTVVIRKAGTTDDASVCYIDQNTSGFTATTDFLMKTGTDDGNYTATFGKEDGSVKTVNFTVGDIAVEGFTFNTDNKMESTDGVMAQSNLDCENLGLDSSKYWKAFYYTIQLDDMASGTNRIYLVSGNSEKVYGYYDLVIPTNLTGAGELTYAIRIFDIDADKQDLNLYVGAKKEEVTQ